MTLIRNLIGVIAQQNRLISSALSREDFSSALTILKNRNPVIVKLGNLLSQIEEVPEEVFESLSGLVDANEDLIRLFSEKRLEIRRKLRTTNATRKLTAKYGMISKAERHMKRNSV